MKTIQKIMEETGVSDTKIRKMLKSGELTPFYIKGYKRVFIDEKQLFSLIVPLNDIDFDRYLV